VPYESPTHSVWYAAYHGYASLVVCAVGIVGNAFNIVVLTRPNMASSATNRILTALAVSDLVTMLVYVPFAVQFYCRRPPAAAATTTFTPAAKNKNDAAKYVQSSGVSRPPVLDCGTTFHLEHGSRDLPSTPSDNLRKLIYLATEALSDSFERIGAI